MAPHHPYGRILIILVCLGLTVPLSAGTRLGTIGGIVVDEVGNGLPRANVFLINAGGSLILETSLTDVDGRFLFQEVVPGQYVLRTERTGYVQSTPLPIRVVAGRVATAPFILRRPADETGGDGTVQPAAQVAIENESLVAGVVETDGSTPNDGPTEETLEDNLRGTVRDVLKSEDQSVASAGTAGDDRPPAVPGSNAATLPAGGSGSTPLPGEFTLLAWSENEEAGSLISAALAGGQPERAVWAAGLSLSDVPSLFLTGPDGGLVRHAMRTRTARFELGWPGAATGSDIPEQSFRLELLDLALENVTANGTVLRSLEAVYSLQGARGARFDLEYIHASSGSESSSGPVDPSDDRLPGDGEIGSSAVNLLIGRLSRRGSSTHDLLLSWRLGSYSGMDGGVPMMAFAGPMGGGTPMVAVPLAQGWETLITGSDLWKALEPLHIQTNLEYRISGGESRRSVARPSIALLYKPFRRTHLSSRLGMAVLSGGSDAPKPQSPLEPTAAPKGIVEETADFTELGRLEYALTVEQGVGGGVSIALDAVVQDIHPGLMTTFDPADPIGGRSRGNIFIPRDGVARSREMSLSLTKDFGPFLAGSWGTSYMEGQGDIVALPAMPLDAALLDGTGDNHRIRCISSQLDTQIPEFGTGILLMYSYLSNGEPGQLSEETDLASEFSHIMFGLQQRLPFIEFAGMEWKLLMAVSSLALNDSSIQDLFESMVDTESEYRRITGGLKVNF